MGLGLVSPGRPGKAVFVAVHAVIALSRAAAAEQNTDPPPPPKKEKTETPPTCSLGTRQPAADILVVLYSPVDFNRSDCNGTDAYPSHPVICLPISENSNKPTSILLPNKVLMVWIIRSDDVTAPQYVPGVAGSPAAAATPPEFAPGNGRPANFVPQALPKSSDTYPPTCVVESYSLAPRPPGPFNVTVQLNDDTGKAIPGSLRAIEFAVEHVYMGAVRVGVGASFPRDGVRSYSVRQTAAGTSAIYEDGHTQGTFDLIAGYSVYLWPYPATTTTISGFHIGLFTGIGLVSASQTAGSLNYFTSLYSGPEFSWRGISLEMLILGVRRGTALAEGFSPGSPLPASLPVPTRTRYQYAPGIAISFTSDVLKVAGVTVP